MTVTGFNPDTGDRHEFPKLEAEHNEDPARFLDSNRLTATARIAGIRDADLLRAYAAVERKITEGNPRTPIVDELRERAADLGVDLELPDGDAGSETPPEPTPEPATATDGGTTTTDAELTDPTGTHADADGLEAGEVLVVDRTEKTEYVFPTTADADAPYLSRAHEDDTGECWMELEIDADDYRERLSKGGERRSLEAIDVAVPESAATGGESA